MSDSLGDSRNLEVHLEDLFGRLVQLRRQRAQSDSAVEVAKEILELSQRLREVSNHIRRKSVSARANTAALDARGALG